MRPRTQFLEADLVGRIIDEALSILETVGVLVDDDQIADRLCEAGLVRDDVSGRLRFPRSVVEQALTDAPSGFTLFDRAGRAHAEIAGERVHFTPASSALRWLDRGTGGIRRARTADFIEYVKVADGLSNLSYLSTAFVTEDVPEQISDAWRLYLLLAHSRQPAVSGAFTADGVGRMAEMMSLLRGGRDELCQKPLAIFTCCPNTPLRWSEDGIRNLVDCAQWGIPVEVVPVLLLGMISPSTPVGALALHTAEVLSGLTIVQLVRPGTAVLFGGAPATFHMRFMTNPMTAVEAVQLCCSYSEIARRLDLPSQAYMGLSDAKRNDPQAGAESSLGLHLAALAGINSVSGPGMLDYVNCFSLEKLVFDDELAAHAHRLVRPVEIKEDLPSGALIEELLSEGHLLTAEHTLEHWPEELYLPGPMVDRTNWDQWEMQGSTKYGERAAEAIDDALERWENQPLEKRVDTALRELLEAGCDDGVALPELA
jgi:trimethylamine--corrinoid protein Co-methyltransferase